MAAAAAARVEHFQKMEMTEKTWSTWCCVAQFPVHKMGEYADNKYCNGLLTDCHGGGVLEIRGTGNMSR